jgi:hypothetical protein
MSLSIISFFFYNNRSYTDKVIIYMMSFSRVYFDFKSCETLMYVARSCLFMYNITVKWWQDSVNDIQN